MLERVAQRLTRGQPVSVVAYGDSISEVGRTSHWFGGAASPQCNWAAVLVARLRQRFHRSRFNLAHFGIGGQNAFEGLGRLDWLGTLPALGGEAPDLVLLEFGANDCGHHHLPPEATGEAIAALIDGVRARHGADVGVLGLAGDNPLQPRFRHPDETAEAIRRTAQEKGAPYADLRAAILRATEDGRRWSDFHLAPDNCHPNDAGHDVWAGAVHGSLLPYLERAFNAEDAEEDAETAEKTGSEK
jgi:lysophospholipase L1-like esterase